MDENDDSEDEFTLLDTAYENGSAFCKTFEDNDCDVSRFLKRETHVPVRSTTAQGLELNDLICYEHDVDGVVIEWCDLKGIDIEIPHLYFLPFGHNSLKPVYNILKKHVKLQRFNANALHVLRRSVGSQLSYSGGWETWIAVVPDFELDTAFESVDFISVSMKALTNLRLIFEKLMKEQIGKHAIDNTLAKNNLNNLSRVRVLPDDQCKVLGLLQASLESLDVGVPRMKKMVFSFRFGEKCRGSMTLPIRLHNSFSSITAHIGLTLYGECQEEDGSSKPIELFWSRIGLQDIVGDRGVITSAYSFKECANFQSNLDGRGIDISGGLRKICLYPQQLRFVQLYADIPHRRPNTRVHPVSGAIALLDGIIKNRKYVDDDAETYLSEIQNNFTQISRSCPRLEMVIEIPDNAVVIRPSEILQIRNVCNLLEKHPLVVPFYDPQFIPILKSVGLAIVNDMKRLFCAYKGTGTSETVWKVYQYELAVEKLLWGHPLCSRSRIFSVNLGPGLEYPSRSQTDMLGFLGLSESTACCADENSSPPFEIYSKSRLTRNRMSKTFGFMDTVGDGCIRPFGRRLVLILLKDLYETGGILSTSFEEFLLSMKPEGLIGSQRVIGGISQKQLAELVGTSEKAQFPMVTGHLIRLLTRKRKDVCSALEFGFRDLGLIRFPAVRLYDQQRNVGLSWKWKYGLYVFTNVPDANENSDIKASLLTPLVITEMETRRLCHATPIKNGTFPWIAPCIDKLSELGLTEKNLVIVLTFVSCVARLMNGAYVDYNRLVRLMEAFPATVTQRRLQTLEIQSKLLLSNFNIRKLWRLHPCIPVNATKAPLSKTAVEKTCKESDVYQNIEALDDPEEISSGSGDTAAETRDVVRIFVEHRPSNHKGRWTPAELSVLEEIEQKLRGNTLSRAEYELYRQACERMGIPDRSMEAVRRKLRRR